MMRSIFIYAAVLLAITSATLARANTDKLDNIAACAGVVLGNGAVDFYLTKGYKLQGWQRRLLRSPLTAALTVASLFVIIPND